MGMVKAEMYDAGLLNLDDDWREDMIVLPRIEIPKVVVTAVRQLLQAAADQDRYGKPDMAEGYRRAADCVLRECGVEL